METLMEVLLLGELSTEDELAWGKDLIDQVLSLSSAGKEALCQLHSNGPTADGDMVSKLGRDELLERGFAAKICMAEGEEGWQALTYRGNWAFKVNAVAAKELK